MNICFRSKHRTPYTVYCCYCPGGEDTRDPIGGNILVSLPLPSLPLLLYPPPFPRRLFCRSICPIPPLRTANSPHLVASVHLTPAESGMIATLSLCVPPLVGLTLSSNPSFSALFVAGAHLHSHFASHRALLAVKAP